MSAAGWIGTKPPARKILLAWEPGARWRVWRQVDSGTKPVSSHARLPFGHQNNCGMARRNLPARHDDASSPGDARFVLFEVVIAFVIAALALGVLYQAALAGLHSTQIAAQ